MSQCNKRIDTGRRQFLRGSAAAAAGAASTVVLPVHSVQAASASAQIDYPSGRLGNVADLATGEPVYINYPDEHSPGILLKVGQPVEWGVGPDSDIVAYSLLCPHKGWRLTYDAADKSLKCPGHFSRFDCEAGGQQIWGHATQNLPEFALRVDDTGDIYAEGASDLIFGRPSNVF